MWHVASSAHAMVADRSLPVSLAQEFDANLALSAIPGLESNHVTRRLRDVLQITNAAQLVGLLLHTLGDAGEFADSLRDCGVAEASIPGIHSVVKRKAASLVAERQSTAAAAEHAEKRLAQLQRAVEEKSDYLEKWRRAAAVRHAPGVEQEALLRSEKAAAAAVEEQEREQEAVKGGADERASEEEKAANASIQRWLAQPLFFTNAVGKAATWSDHPVPGIGTTAQGALTRGAYGVDCTTQTFAGGVTNAAQLVGHYLLMNGDPERMHCLLVERCGIDEDTVVKLTVPALHARCKFLVDASKGELVPPTSGWEWWLTRGAVTAIVLAVCAVACSDIFLAVT